MTAYRFGALLVVLCCAALPAVADDAEIKKTAKVKATECQESLIKGDYDTLVSLTHPKIVEALGGQKKMVETVRAEMKKLKDVGFEFKSVKVSDPSDPLTVEKELYITVPFTLELKTPDNRIVTKGALIGVSSDNGKTWAFADAAPGREKLKTLIPGLPDKLEIPKKEPPKIIKE